MLFILGKQVPLKQDVRVALGALLLILLILLSAYTKSLTRSTAASDTTPAPQLSPIGRVCYDCHVEMTADLVHRLEEGKHLANGVDCFSCHDAAGKGERSDTQDHYGYRIITQVTFKDCAECHPREIPSLK